MWKKGENKKENRSSIKCLGYKKKKERNRQKERKNEQKVKKGK